MKELKKSIAHLEHEKQEALRMLREVDKTSGHDERLERIEKLTQLEVIEDELQEKYLALQSSRLMPTKRERFKVALGSVVDLIDTNGRLVRYTIVDSIEANPSDGRISILSPLGKNLIGKTVHDVVEWSAGFRTNQMRLVHIH
jgi:transcription elongation factor GreA